MSVRWKPGVILLLLLQAFWLNVVLPGHQRGLIVMGGPVAAVAAEKADCHAATKCCPTKSAPADPTKSDDPDRKSRCAVCAFAARLTVPPAPITAPTLLELRPEVAELSLHTLFESDLPPAYWGRGPPAL
jgi:hypothetical protein